MPATRLVFLCWLMPLAAAAQSNIGPIATPQINRTFYAGTQQYPTVQSAVTMACTLAGGGTVVREFGAVTNDTPVQAVGCAQAAIVDGNAVLPSYYTWVNGFYVLSAPSFSSLMVGVGGISTSGTLSVTGTSSLSGMVTMTGGAQVGAAGGNANINVYGSISETGALTVGPVGTTSGYAVINGQEDIYGGVTVKGNAQFGQLGATTLFDVLGPINLDRLADATSSANANSNQMDWNASYWGGSTPNTDQWSVANILGSGVNPTSTLTFSHGGSSGAASVGIPALTVTGASSLSGMVTMTGGAQVGSAAANENLKVYGNITATDLVATSGSTFAGAVQVGQSGSPANFTVYGNSGVFGNSGVTGTSTAAIQNATTGFQVNGTALASTNLSDTSSLARLTSNISGTAANVTGTVAVANGGTGATSTTGALANLGALPLTGGTLTGALSLSADPTSALQAATKQYVDAHAGTTLPAASAANQFLASTGATSTYGPRALASADIPANAANTTGTAANVTGTVTVANGGTGATSASAALAALGGLSSNGGTMAGTYAGNPTFSGTPVYQNLPTLPASTPSGNQPVTATYLAATAPVVYGVANTQLSTPHIVSGSQALQGGGTTVSLSTTDQFTSTTSYYCTATDTTGVYAVQVTMYSRALVTLHGNGTDVISYVCVGN